MKRFYMWFVNYFKVGVIWLTDIVNHINPFEVRPSAPSLDSLEKLETLFYADLEARFMQPSGEFFYTIPRPSDAGDTALFQGLATAMKIMKGTDVSKQIDFINRLFANGTLIRGYDNQGIANDTTSNDSATGLLFFFYVALRWGTDDVRTKAGALIRTWVNNLRAHNWALVDLHGNATKYGALEDGVMTDPLRITLLLGILAVAMAYDSKLNQDYSDLYHMYEPILRYPKVKLLWWDTPYDTHRAAIHLHVLYWMTKDEVYKEGLQRIWRITEREQNAWVYTLCSIALDKPSGELVENRLSTFDFAARQRGNLESLNLDQPSVQWPPRLPFGLTSLVIRCKYALPFFLRGSQDFFWQRHSFSRSEWVGNAHADTYHSGLDFLICGWLANRLGLLK